jgi:hypothetical protein
MIVDLIDFNEKVKGFWVKFEKVDWFGGWGR